MASRICVACANRSFLRCCCGREIKGFKAASCADHYNRISLLVLWCGLQLILGQFESDGVVIPDCAAKMQRIPAHRDFAAADAKKTAKIDNRCTCPASPIDNDVNDATYFFPVGALHGAA